MSYLDNLLLDMRERGLRFLAEGPVKNRLQPMFLEDLRFEHRMKSDVIVVQSATVEGWSDPVNFVIADEEKRVAVQLVPKDVSDYFKGFEYGVLSGGDVDAVVRFSGPDLHYRGKDCLGVFAQLHSDLYHHNGIWNTLNEAEPMVRQWEPSQPGWDAIDILCEDEYGEPQYRQLRFYWGRRHRRRRDRLARRFRTPDAAPFDDFDEFISSAT